MTQFALALLSFLALHSIPAIPALRQRLVARLGRRAYLVLYSLVSLLALGWVFHSALALDFVELWPPAPWQAWVALVLSPLALFLLIAGLISPNAASISFRAGGSQGAVTAITRHPVLWGFVLWAAGHITANGDLRSLVLFGSFALFALFGMLMAERRGRKNLGAQWAAIERTTAILPLAALVQGRARWSLDRWQVIALLAAAAITGWLLLGGHLFLFNADPLAMAAN